MPTIGDCGNQILIIVKNDEVTGNLLYWSTTPEGRWVWYRESQMCEYKDRLNVFLSDFYVQQHMTYLVTRDPEPMCTKPRVLKYCCDLTDVEPDCPVISGGPIPVNDSWSNW